MPNPFSSFPSKKKNQPHKGPKIARVLLVLCLVALSSCWDEISIRQDDSNLTPKSLTFEGEHKMKFELSSELKDKIKAEKLNLIIETTVSIDCFAKASWSYKLEKDAQESSQYAEHRNVFFIGHASPILQESAKAVYFVMEDDQDQEEEGVKTQNSKSKKKIEATVIAYLSKAVQIMEGQNYNISVAGQERIFTRTKLKNLSGSHKLPLKMEFSAGMSFKGKNMEVYGWFVKDEKHEYKMSSTTTNLFQFTPKTIGYIINSEDTDLYCEVSSGCYYSTVVHTTNVDTIQAQAKQLQYSPVLKVDEGTIDQLHKDKVKHYEIQDTQGKDLVITLTPVEGSANLFANVGYAPEDLDKWMFIMKTHSSKRIVIEDSEIRAMRGKGKSIIIAVKAESTVAYELNVDEIQDSTIMLDTGIVECGKIKGPENRNHLFIPNGSRSAKVATVHVLNFKLHLEAGDAKFMVKACDGTGSCEIQPHEYRGNSTANFKIAQGNGSQKEIYLPVVCLSEDGKDLKEEDYKSYLRLKSGCQFAVTISGQTGSKTFNNYELAVEDSQEVTLLNKNHFIRVNMLPQHQKMFTFKNKISSSMKMIKDKQAADEELKMVFDVHFGKIRICAKQADRKLDAKEFNNFHNLDCDKEVVIAGHRQGLSNLYQTIDFDNVDGDFQILVESDSYSSYSLGTIVQSKSLFDRGEIIYRPLKAGVYETGVLKGINEISYFTFEIDQKYRARSLNLALVPLRGKFKFSVTNNGSRPQPFQDFWVTEDNHLMIDHNDAHFQDKATYNIAVFPVADIGEESDYKEVPGHPEQEQYINKSIENPDGTEIQVVALREKQFKLRVTYSDQDIELQSGFIEQGVMHQRKVCFAVPVKRDYKELLFIKGALNHSNSLYGSFTHISEYPVSFDHQFKAPQGHSGFQIKEADIAKHCSKVHEQHHSCFFTACLYGEPGSHYEIGFTHDNRPFVMAEGQTVQFPLVLNQEKPIHIVVHASQGRPLEIEFSTQYYGAKVGSVLLDESKLKQSFEQFFLTKEQVDKNKSYHQDAGVISYSEKDTQDMSKPIALVSLFAANNYWKSTEDYFFNIDQTISISGDFRTIPAQAQFEGYSSPGIMQIYKIHVDKEEPFVVEISRIDAGMEILYISKGSHSIPSASNTLTTGNFWSGSLLEVTPDMIKQKGINKVRGVYMVGVKGITRGRYSISWRPTKKQYVSANYNQEVSLKFSKKNHFQAHLVNYMQNSDLEFLVQPLSSQDFTISVATVDLKKDDLAKAFEMNPTPKKDSIWNFEVKGGQIKRFKILKNDTNMCYNCAFVFNFNTDSEADSYVKFRPVIAQKWSALMLPVGKPFYDSLLKGESQKYIYDIREGVPDMDIEILKGKVNLYFGDSRGVDIEKKTYVFSTSLDQGGYFKLDEKHIVKEDSEKDVSSHMHIRGQNSHFMIPRYMAVDCDQDCTFSINILNDAIVNELHHGVTKLTELGPGRTHKYYFKSEGPGEKQKFHQHLFMRLTPQDPLLSLNSQGNFVDYQMFYTPDFASINDDYEKLTLMDPLKASTSENRMFENRKGYYIVLVRNTQPIALKYMISTSLGSVNTLKSGNYNIELVKTNQERRFEFYATNAGTLDIQLNKCGSLVDLYVNQNDYWERFNNPKSSKYNFWLEVDRPKVVQLSVKPKYEMQENILGLKADNFYNAFGIEIYEHVQEVGKNPWDGVTAGSNGLVQLDLSSFTSVNFNPIKVEDSFSEAYQYSVKYVVAYSRAKSVVEYFKGCGQQYMNIVLPFESQDFHLKEMETIDHLNEDGGAQYSVELTDYKAATEYHGVVVAIITANQFGGQRGVSTTHRLVYNEFQFTTQRWLIPIEYLGASLGVAGLFLIMIYWIYTFMRKCLRGGKDFEQLRQSDDIEGLQDYFMNYREEGDQNRADESYAQEGKEIQQREEQAPVEEQKEEKLEESEAKEVELIDVIPQ